MKRLLDLIEGITKKAIGLIVTVAAFAVAGSVGTSIFHGRPSSTSATVDDLSDQGTSRKISSLPHAPARPTSARPTASSPSSAGEAPPDLSPRDPGSSGQNNQGPAIPIGASSIQPALSRQLAANQQAAAEAASRAASSTGSSATASTDSGAGSGDPDFAPDTAASATATSVSASTSSDTLSLTNVSPSAGLWLGGTTVYVQGSDFLSGTPSVTIGNGNCSSVTVYDDGDLTCAVPSGSIGTYNVVVSVDAQTATMTNVYTYDDFSTVTTLAGQIGAGAGTAPTGNNTAIATSAGFNTVVDVAAAGTLVYAADDGNHVIKQIDMVAGNVTVLAGDGSATVEAPIYASGTSAHLDTVSALDLNGTNLYYSTCGASATINLVNLASSNAVTNIMGGAPGAASDANGSSAVANCIGGIADDGTYIYFADNLNYKIRKVLMTSPYTVTTLAGSGSAGVADGTGTAATFHSPWGLTYLNGSLYIGDGDAIRVLNLSTLQVTTLAGSIASSGFVDGTGTSARFTLNSGAGGGLIRNAGGVIFVADQGNDAIREVTTGGVVTTLFGTSGSSGDADGAISSATTLAPASVFYLPALGLIIPNATVVRYAY